MFRPATTILLALSLAIPSAAAAARKPIAKASVTIDGHSFNPSPIYLSAGVPVRLTISNPTGDSHEFKAPEFFYWAKIRAGRVTGGKIVIESGQRRTLILVPRRGSYKVRCGRFAHALLGESTTIVVY